MLIIQHKKKDLTAKEKGAIGEKKIQKEFFKGLNRKYEIFNNVTFLDEHQYTTQIDHIILGPYGLFVLEVKNYSGWIYAQPYKKNWIQSFPTKSIEFQNPILQNYRHTKVLKYILNSNDIAGHIHSVIIFSENSTFKTALPDHVFQGKHWIRHIKSFNDVVFSEQQINAIRDKISQHQLPISRKTNHLHIKSIQRRLNEHSHI